MDAKSKIEQAVAKVRDIGKDCSRQIYVDYSESHGYTRLYIYRSQSRAGDSEFILALFNEFFRPLLPKFTLNAPAIKGDGIRVAYCDMPNSTAIAASWPTVER